MRIFRLFVGAVAVAALSACGDVPTGPAGLDVEPSFDEVGDEQEVELSGRTFTTAGSGKRIVTVHAESEDGEAEGQYRIDLTASGIFLTVDVTCVAAEGDTAWVAGIISDTNASFIQLGTVSYFFVIDNGDGDDGDEPDVVSAARINDIEGEDLLFCRDRPLLLPSTPVEGGDMELEIDD